jgi:hypothetical protein
MRGKVAAPFFFPLPHLLPAGGVGRRFKGWKQYSGWNHYGLTITNRLRRKVP